MDTAFAGFFYMFVAVFMLIVGILAVLMPFFVLRIRNEVIAANKKLTEIIEHMEANNVLIGKLPAGGYRSID